jgi:hypothetical protein
VKKKFIKTILYIVGILFLLIVALISFIFIKQDEIKNILVLQLNKQLITPIEVSNISIEVFTSFPKTSLELNNAIAKDEKDTLFYFKKVYLSFDVWDIFNKKYDINNILLEDGFFNMHIDSLGKENYIFWKEGKKDTSSFKISLKKIRLKNINYTFKNDITKQYYSFLILNAKAKGDFSNKEQLISLSSSLKLNTIRIDNLIIRHNHKILLELSLNNSTKNKRLKVEKGEISIDELPFLLSGNLIYEKNKENIALNIKSNNIKIEKAVNLLPEKQRDFFKEYKGSGSLAFSFDANGKINKKEMPKITAYFNVNNAKLINKKQKINFENIVLKGSFSNGEKRKSSSSYINLDTLAFNFSGGKIRGRARIENLNKLNISASLKGNIPLEELKKLINQKEISLLKGDASLFVELKGDIPSLKKIHRKGFSNISLSAKGEIRNANYVDERIKEKISNLNANFILDNNDIEIKKAYGEFGKTDFTFSGYLKNILPYIFDNKNPINIIGKTNINNLFVDELFSNKEKEERKRIKEKENTKNNCNKINIPKFINLKIDANINNLIYSKIKAKNVSSTLLIKEGKINANNLKMDVFDGKIKGDLLFSTSKQEAFLSGKVNLDKVNIQKMFFFMDNFHQKSITDRNIEGKLYSDINFSFSFDSCSNFISDKIMLNANYKILDGELKDVNFLKKLSYFVDEKALNWVKFSEINSSLTIKNSCILFDLIDIRTNAINFSFLGQHYFNNNIDYNLSIKLSELSSKKHKEKMKNQEKIFGQIEKNEDKTLTLFIKVKGTIDNPIFKYDMNKSLEKVTERLKKDKKAIINSLDRDLKLGIEQSKKDKKYWEKQEKGEYIIEWDEEDEKKEEKNHQNEENYKETNFSIEWE